MFLWRLLHVVNLLLSACENEWADLVALPYIQSKF